MSSLSYYLSQLRHFPSPKKADLSGQTVVVVGANAGIGFETAKHFARMQPGKLILACRNAAKGQAALSAIQEETGFKNIAVRTVELASFSSVANFAAKFEKEEVRLDILVYNAGIATRRYETTEDNWETTLQINDLSCSLLTLLLLPKMLKTAEHFKTRPRIVVVTSLVHFWTNVNEAELASPKILEKVNDRTYCTESGAMMRRYSFSKLLNVMFVHELTSRLPPDSPIIITCVCPGYCLTDFRRNIPRLQSLYAAISAYLYDLVFGRTAEQGSRHVVWAALGGKEKEERMRGAFVADLDVREPNSFLFSKEGMQAQKRIWNETVELLVKAAPAVKPVVEKHLIWSTT